MAYQFALSGSYSVTPLTGAPSLVPTIDAPIDEPVVVDVKHEQDIELASDAPQAVSFGGVTNAHVVIIKTDQKVKAALTSADGSAQAVPVDGVLVVISKTVPVTAISLTRVPSVATLAHIFLAEKA